MVFFLLTSVANITVMNEKFVANQVTNSEIGSSIVTEVNSSASDYGLSEKILTKSITNELLTDAIGDVYEDRNVSIDFDPVYNRIDKLVDQKVEGLGYGSTTISSTLKSEIQSGLTTVINKYLNTSELSEVSEQVANVRKITNVVWAVSGIILLIMAMVALFRRFLLNGSGWILLIGGIISTVLLKAGSLVLYQLMSSITDLSSSATQISGAIFAHGLVYLLAGIIVGLLLIVLSFVLRRR